MMGSMYYGPLGIADYEKTHQKVDETLELLRMRQMQNVNVAQQYRRVGPSKEHPGFWEMRPIGKGCDYCGRSRNSEIAASTCEGCGAPT